MKKLFTGKFGRIPVAVLAIVLISVLVAGGVVAATGGYTLWSGTGSVTVTEPIAIFRGASQEACTTELVLGVTLEQEFVMAAGACADTWFKITNVASHDLLIKAQVTTSVGEVVFYDASGVEIPIASTGVIVNAASGSMFIRRSFCISGAEPPSTSHTISTTFTRESPPV